MDLSSIAAMLQAKFWWAPFVFCAVYLLALAGTHFFKAGTQAYAYCAYLLGGVRKLLPPGWGYPGDDRSPPAPTSKGFSRLGLLALLGGVSLAVLTGCAAFKGATFSGTLGVNGQNITLAVSQQAQCVSDSSWVAIPGTNLCTNSVCVSELAGASGVTVAVGLNSTPGAGCAIVSGSVFGLQVPLPLGAKKCISQRQINDAILMPPVSG